MKKSDQAVPNSVLRSERILHYWTQIQVADLLGTTKTNVYRWESGLTTPSLYFRQKLCDLFGKSAEELGLLSESERQEQAAADVSPFSKDRENVLTLLPTRDPSPVAEGSEDLNSSFATRSVGAGYVEPAHPQPFQTISDRGGQDLPGGAQHRLKDILRSPHSSLVGSAER